MTMETADSRPALAFPVAHYGCPDWCTANSSPGGHDSGDGMPDWPGFAGYQHYRDRHVPYAAAEPFIVHDEVCRNPMYVGLQQDPGWLVPRVHLLNEDERVPVDVTLTVDEAQLLAETLLELVAASRR